MTLIRLRILPCLLLVLVLGPLALPIRAEGPIDGRWLLDLENSDDIEAVFAAALKPSKRRKKSKQDVNTVSRDRKPPPLLDTESLTIHHRSSSIELIPAEGEPLLVVPGGPSAPISLSKWGADQQAAQQFSAWEGDTLVIETTREGGTRITQSYRVNPAGELVQDIELFAGPRGHAKATRLFKPAIAQGNN